MPWTQAQLQTRCPRFQAPKIGEAAWQDAELVFLQSNYPTSQSYHALLLIWQISPHNCAWLTQEQVGWGCQPGTPPRPLRCELDGHLGQSQYFQLHTKSPRQCVWSTYIVDPHLYLLLLICLLTIRKMRNNPCCPVSIFSDASSSSVDCWCFHWQAVQVSLQIFCREGFHWNIVRVNWSTNQMKRVD